MQTLIRKTSRVVAWILAGIGAVLLGSAIWISRTFGPINVDQLLMHLPGAGGGETTGAEGGYLVSFLLFAVVIPLGVLWVIALIAHVATVIRRRRILRSDTYSARPRHLGWIAGLTSVAVFAGGLFTFGQSIQFTQYARAATTSYSMADYYGVPDLGGAEAVSINEGEQPKNLVTIFLESGEEAYSDQTLFETDMMASLDDATAGWQQFDSLTMYEGGGWTMAGLVGSECGVPLRGTGILAKDADPNEIGVDGHSFLPGATCLGDVLDDAGYTSVFMGGADASFASKKNYLTSHGYDHVYDLPHWWASGEVEISGWGLSDRRLFEHAKAEVTALHESGAPFQLTLLTLDIHEPLYVYEHCKVTTKDPAESVQRCSTQAAADFVSYLDEMGYLEDTVVMFVGDHPKMLGEEAAFNSELARLDTRNLYNRLWTPGQVVIERNEIDQLSLYATLLDLLDLGRQDGRAGVGASALRPPDSAEGITALPYETYLEVIQSRSKDLYARLWDAEVPEDA